MTNREKAIDGLEMLRFFNQRAGRELWGDKRHDVQETDIVNADAIFELALTMLKDQEPRVVTLDEIKTGESYWFQMGHRLPTRPVICLHREDNARKPYITFAWQFGMFSWDSEDYGKTWRCWTAKPTNEQSEVVKWDD